jgi:hypothetical protein
MNDLPTSSLLFHCTHPGLSMLVVVVGCLALLSLFSSSHIYRPIMAQFKTRTIDTHMTKYELQFSAAAVQPLLHDVIQCQIFFYPLKDQSSFEIKK